MIDNTDVVAHTGDLSDLIEAGRDHMADCGIDTYFDTDRSVVTWVDAWYDGGLENFVRANNFALV
jgi:hypothetical protein